MRVTVVGICGPSGSGKSSITAELKTLLRCRRAAILPRTESVLTFCLDDYFDPTRMPPHEKYGQNWELPTGLRWDAFLAELNSTISRLKDTVPVEYNDVEEECVIILEGFLLFYRTDVAALCNVCFFVDCDAETCCERRFRRTALKRLDKHNKQHDSFSVPIEYYTWFMELVWYHYMEFRTVQIDNMQSNATFFILNGCEDLQKSVNFAFKEVDQRMKSNVTTS
eukprot:PhM_4_TR15278/c0_g1_i1/m.42049/K00876/udk, UCK; uridine kinase